MPWNQRKLALYKKIPNCEYFLFAFFWTASCFFVCPIFIWMSILWLNEYDLLRHNVNNLKWKQINIAILKFVMNWFWKSTCTLLWILWNALILFTLWKKTLLNGTSRKFYRENIQQLDENHLVESNQNSIQLK